MVRIHFPDLGHDLTGNLPCPARRDRRERLRLAEGGSGVAVGGALAGSGHARGILDPLTDGWLAVILRCRCCGSRLPWFPDPFFHARRLIRVFHKPNQWILRSQMQTRGNHTKNRLRLHPVRRAATTPLRFHKIGRFPGWSGRRRPAPPRRAGPYGKTTITIAAFPRACEFPRRTLRSTAS
ncbi:hypothetical protein AvCA_39850 [Azotobacter vinelandii CA]|uniref:Uncharacterized protein n=2 Tax=Azotobacter vinelandii TaxID=354 RepID=C1DE16_AZOVD|nr:hypothetical protein Avin_39850 [Azotobacter vinelandii DJ]AGK14483.1 hypothetical protein AvCA_39850 [Azotobacter vinelandii CA]AGK21712.1 hypothetical protein AvCA6_39850 [Azotobacter vinelandii CA6]